MYHSYFGLKEAPFSIAVNPRYLFMSARHRDALAHLLYGVGVGGGFILLTGEVGTGKTTINRSLLEQIPDNTDIALILNPALNAAELLATVCDELGIEYQTGESSLKILTDKLHQFLLSNYSKGRNTVLLIDEAQHLQFDVLEQIRLLTNLETNTKKLLQIILVGQPELRTLLNKPELRQLAQRITARYQLKPLNLSETQAYIRHRLQVAGLPANQILFPNNIVKGIHKVSRGVPRIINVLCDRMLLGTYGQNKIIVDQAMLKQSIIEVMGEEDDIQLTQKTSFISIVSVIAVISVISLLLWQWSNSEIKNALKTSIINTKSSDIGANNLIIDQEVEPIIATSFKEPIWTSSEAQAINELLNLLVIPISSASSLCYNPNLKTPRCERLTVNTWQELLEYNRPAVLSLITKSKMQVYTTLIAINNDQAMLRLNGKTITLPLSIIGEMWTGDIVFIWQPAEIYTAPFSKDYNGPLVKWLAQQFALLDGQKKLLADKKFNAALTQRVKIFQQNNQLTADGVVGLKTLLKLDEKLGRATPLLMSNTINSKPAIPAPNTLINHSKEES
jgi:general secretion pathway protein A